MKLQLGRTGELTSFAFWEIVFTHSSWAYLFLFASMPLQSKGTFGLQGI